MTDYKPTDPQTGDDFKDVLLAMTEDGVTIDCTPTFTDFLKDVEVEE